MRGNSQSIDEGVRTVSEVYGDEQDEKTAVFFGVKRFLTSCQHRIL